VGDGGRLGRKNKAKAEKTNETSDDGEGREDERDVRRWCAHAVKRPRGRAIATARVGVGAGVGQIREETFASTPSAENGVVRKRRHEGREKRSRMTNEVAATEARTIIIVQRYRWPNGLCLTGRTWASPARALCLGCSLGP
jgi:hypothetical protein